MEIHDLSGADLIQTWRDYKRMGLSQRDLARDLHTTTGALRGKMYRYKMRIEEQPQHFEVDLPDAPWELSGDAMVIGDIHAPTVDYDLAMMPAAIAKKHLKSPRQLIIAGDVFNTEACSSYPRIWRDSLFKQEKIAIAHLLGVWLKTFDEIWVMPGNHDRRMAKMTRGEFLFEDLFDTVLGCNEGKLNKYRARVHTSEYGYCYLNRETMPWMIAHSKNYSINQLTVADQLAQKYQMNVITNHTHHLAKGMDRFKRYVIIENGGLFDATKFSYVVLDANKSAGMTPGFTMIRNDCAFVFGHEPYTDWEFWL